MPVVDLVDETFIVGSPNALAKIIADRNRWQRWWPGVSLVVFMDRGPKGIRWTVTGELVGSAEIWLEAFGDGVLLHYYLRVDPTRPNSDTVARELGDSPRARRSADRIRRRQALRWKQNVWALKAEVEGDRPPGSGVWDKA